jgi:GNAT superfamily N-acetyltransferase
MIKVEEIFVSELLYDDNASYLFSEYAKESQVDTVIADSSPNTDKYLSLEEEGLIRVIGLYKDDTLVGFTSLIIQSLNHHNKNAGIIDSIFVLPKYRSGGNPKKLIQKVEEVAKEAECIVITMPSPIGGRLEKVAKYFRYKPTNIIFSKAL